MYWNGIPFPFVDSLTKENLTLQITKLPTLIIDSGFPWESLVGAFIAGSIPAFIAWKTIKNNNEAIKRQITLAAQQKKCEELRDMFANYISLQSNLVSYLELIYDEHGGDREKIPFGIITETRNDFYKVKHCETLIYLLIGTEDPFYERVHSLIEDIDERIDTFFYEYNNESTEMFSLDEDNKNLLSLFSEILKREQAKI
jgi:hypothetical protein